MSEEYGNISDGFFLSPEEIENLRNAKKELAEYGKSKIRELMNQKALEVSANVETPENSETEELTEKLNND